MANVLAVLPSKGQSGADEFQEKVLKKLDRKFIGDFLNLFCAAFDKMSVFFSEQGKVMKEMARTVFVILQNQKMDPSGTTTNPVPLHPMFQSNDVGPRRTKEEFFAFEEELKIQAKFDNLVSPFFSYCFPTVLSILKIADFLY